MANFPTFFKVFLSERSLERLSFPPALVPHLRGALPDKVKLKNHQGKLWVVKITSDEDTVYLTNGWRKFVQENDVQDRDFLVFYYDGSYVFDVKLYGFNTCKKTLPLSSDKETDGFHGDESDDTYMVDIVEEEEEEEFEAENCRKGEAKIGKCAKGKGRTVKRNTCTKKVPISSDEENEFSGDESDYTYRVEIVEEEEKEFEVENCRKEEKIGKYVKGKGKIVKRNTCKKKVPISSDEETDGFSGDESDDTYMMEIEEEEEEEFKWENYRNGKEKTVKCANGKKNHKGKGLGKTEKGSCQTSDDEVDIFKYGIIARPKTPYFVSKLREKRSGSLYIPLDVIRDFDLKLPNPIVIRDEKNRKWKSEVKVWEDGRTWLTDGWKRFRRVNQLTLQDRCLCELVEETDQTGLFLKLRILRAGSWLPNRGE